MRGAGKPTFASAAVLAVVLVTTSFGTAWTTKTPPTVSLVDPSLRVGEVALVHTTSGHAGALSTKLSGLGAVDVETEAAADTVIARLSADALAALKTDATVTVATRDLVVTASGAGRGGFEKRSDDPSQFLVPLSSNTATIAWFRTRGAGATVAIMDTGVADHPDLRGKVLARVDFVQDGSTLDDPGGHGTFVAGAIAANGTLKGVAPDATLVSLRVLDANGNGTAANVVRAFNWLLQHRVQYGIDVLNISWGAPQASSYQNDYLSALVESAWFSGITVVVAAGNNGAGAATVTSPASDPFVVSVGAYSDQGTYDFSDDAESAFSSRGLTLDRFAKPDTLAPGEHVLGLRAAGVTYLAADGTPIGLPTDRYIHMTGTSVSAAFVSGIAALVESARPTLTPTQVKGAIVASGRTVVGASAKAVDATAALWRTPAAVNVGLVPSSLLLALLTRMHALKVAGITWEGVTWDGITWETVSWETVTWESVSWETVSWEGIAWERVLQ